MDERPGITDAEIVLVALYIVLTVVPPLGALYLLVRFVKWAWAN